MFKERMKGYIRQEAPATVIPHCMPVSMAKKQYNLEIVCKLASNENPLGVSPKAMEAMAQAIPTAYFYSDGSREKVLAGKLAQRHGVGEGNIFIAGGAASVLSHIADLFLLPGDACVIPSPAYPPYYFWAYKNSAAIVEVPCRQEDQAMDTAAILAAVNGQTKLLFLCNPNNPTSTAVPREELVALLKCLPAGVVVVADEAYVDFSDDPDGLTLVPYLAAFPNLIVVRTFSKIYGMASARLGYGIACEEIIQCMEKAVSARGINTFGVEGGIAALDDEAFRQETIANNRAERAYLTEAVTALGYKVYKSQANFIWVDFGRPARDVHDDLLPYGVIIRGDFAFARISIGLHRENETLVKALGEIKARR